MAQNTVTTADDFLKTLYPEKRVKYLGYKDNPFLAMVKKDENFKGRNKAIVCHYAGAHGGRSRTFATAQANASPERGVDFLITRTKDYCVDYIATEALEASEGDMGSFLSLSKGVVESCIRAGANNLAMGLFRNHGGARGQVGSINSGAMTLLNINDVVNFEQDMVLVQSTADGTSGALGSGESTVTGVNRRTGIITAANWTNFTANDYLFQKGDFGLSVHGLPSWVPATAPSASENFFGVDRSVDSRLYGGYHDGSSQTIQEAIEAVDAKVHREGGTIDVVYMNPIDINAWRVSLADNVRYDMVRSSDLASVSFGSIKVNSMSGKGINIVADRNVPQGKAFALQMDTWELSSLGPAPKILQGMGCKFIWASTSDAIEIRTGYYAELGCSAPNFNYQILLPS
jgi:hypothetical protein